MEKNQNQVQVFKKFTFMLISSFQKVLPLIIKTSDLQKQNKRVLFNKQNRFVKI